MSRESLAHSLSPKLTGPVEQSQEAQGDSELCLDADARKPHCPGTQHPFTYAWRGKIPPGSHTSGPHHQGQIAAPP